MTGKILNHLEEVKLQVICFRYIPEYRVIRGLLPGFDLAQFHACVSGGAPEHLAIEDYLKSDSVAGILGWAFTDKCRSRAIDVPSCITNIEPQAFSYMTALEEAVIPASVATPSAAIFSDCYNLKSVFAPSAWQDDIDEAGVLEYCYNATVYWYDGEMPDLVSVTFDAGDGEIVNALSVRRTLRGGSVTGLPEPALMDNVFLGWFTEGGVEVTEETTFDEDATVYARYAGIDYGWYWNFVDGGVEIQGAEEVLPYMTIPASDRKSVV